MHLGLCLCACTGGVLSVLTKAKFQFRIDHLMLKNGGGQALSNTVFPMPGL